jgi:hypothetical protein
MAFIPKERNSLTVLVFKADLLLLLLKLLYPTAGANSNE